MIFFWLIKFKKFIFLFENFENKIRKNLLNNNIKGDI